MTASEFCAWLDGFSASIDDAPSAAQWKQIKEHRQSVCAEKEIVRHSPSMLAPLSLDMEGRWIEPANPSYFLHDGDPNLEIRMINKAGVLF